MRLIAAGLLALLAACGAEPETVSSSPDTSAQHGTTSADLPSRTAVAGTAWRSADEVLSSELPRGWTVAAAEPGRVLVNPGLKESDRLDCLLVVVWGRLDESQRGLDAVATMEAHDAELRAELKAQQVDLRAPEDRPKRVPVGGFDGAERMYAGKAAGNRVGTWVGTTLQEGWHATVVAVVVAGKEERYLPGARRILEAARISPPKADPGLDAQLAGGEYSGTTSFGGGGAIHVVYRFARGGSVTRTSLVSGSFAIDGATAGESTKRGSWTSSGSRLRLVFVDDVEDAQLERDGSRVRAIVVGDLRCMRR